MPGTPAVRRSRRRWVAEPETGSASELASGCSAELERTDLRPWDRNRLQGSPTAEHDAGPAVGLQLGLSRLLVQPELMGHGRELIVRDQQSGADCARPAARTAQKAATGPELLRADPGRRVGRQFAIGRELPQKPFCRDLPLHLLVVKIPKQPQLR